MITNLQNTLKKHVFVALLTSLTLPFYVQPSLSADGVVSPDILILGDSQITFGSGTEYLKFFKNLKKSCSHNAKQSKSLEKLGAGSVGVIGVRSSTLATWTGRRKQTRAKVCDVDPKWKVNAGAYGVINKSGKKYVQIGQGKQYQFCKKGLSPFEAAFEKGNYEPKLLVLSFLGNSSMEWAENPNKALKDVRRTVAQLPADMPCIYITTAPTFTRKSVDKRLKAQENLRKAFAKTGNRCTFVDGLNEETIAANLGNKLHFRLKKSGAVKDPYHPNKRGARKFFSITKDNICAAVFSQLSNDHE